MPSLSSSEHGRHRPVPQARPLSGEIHRQSRERLQPPPTTTAIPPETGITPPIPPTHTPNPQANQPTIAQETHQDPYTGNTVTTATTTNTTTTTTTGPGGSTTVQVSNNESGSSSPHPNATNTTGPHPPLPAPITSTPHLHPSRTHKDAQYTNNPTDSINANYSPPIPSKSTMRDRVELGSTSPAVLLPNQGGSPVTLTSPSRPNASYPDRKPPAGVPIQVPA